MLKPHNLAIGQVRKIDGKNCLILDGYLLDPVHQRVSNWWYWSQINSYGELTKTTGGYGQPEKWPLVEYLPYRFEKQWVKVRTKKPQKWARR